MRLSRLFASVVSMSLLALPAAVATAGAATAAEPIPTKVYMQVSASKLLYGAPLSIQGQVVAPGPSGGEVRVPTGQARLERQLKGQTSWAVLETDPYGDTFYFSVRAVANATYRVVYSGGSYDHYDTSTGTTTTYDFAPSSASRALWVSRDLGARAVEPRPGAHYLKGNVNPGWGNKVIRLERKKCKGCAWTVYSKQRTTSTGGYRFAVGFPRSGTWFYRTSVPATTTHLKSTSGVFRAYVYRY